MKSIIELYSAEGGEDSSLFVADMANAYGKMFGRLG